MVDSLEQFIACSLCGLELSKLVSQAHVLIAEISSLRDALPKIFLESYPRSSPYFSVLNGFKYFQDEDKVNNEIKKDRNLLELDLKIWEDNEDFIRRSVNCFHAINTYRSDLLRFFTELDLGVYGSESMESVATNPIGKQLLVEAVYLMGIILLTLDQKIEGQVRERLLVIYCRHADWRSTFGNSFVDMCTLFRGSNYASTKSGQRYLEKLFERAEVGKQIVNFLIFGLRNDPSEVQSLPDLLPNLPVNGDLVDQSAMAFVLLHFVPNVLDSCPVVMEEIVKKYYLGNFVISLYMGTTVNLLYEWDRFKAARRALKSQCNTYTSKKMSVQFYNDIERFYEHPFVAHPEGLDKHHVVSNMHSIIQAVRQMNKALRWSILNCCATVPEWNNVKLWRTWQSGIDRKLTLEYLFRALLSAAEYEQRVKEIAQSLLDSRVEAVKSAQREVVEKLDHLLSLCSDGAFTDELPGKIEEQQGLARRDDVRILAGSLAKRLLDAKDAIQNMSPEKPQTCGPILSLALKHLQAMKMEDSFGTRAECLLNDVAKDVQGSISKFMELQTLREDSMVALQHATDFTYGWELIHGFREQLRLLIRVQPSSSVVLRPLFFKLSSAFSPVLRRIEQTKNASFGAVSHFYSAQLISFLTEVVSVIPASIFVLLSEVMRIRSIKEYGLPRHVAKADLVHHSRLEQRQEISKLVNAIILLAEGMLPLRTTVLGVIEVDPKQLLTDGILEELISEIFELLNSSFVYKRRGKPGEFSVNVTELEWKISAYRDTFEYISDYLGISGLYIWHEAFDHVLKRSFVHCLNSELKVQVDSAFDTKPLRKHREALEFVAKFTKHLMEETSPSYTVFMAETNLWLDVNTQEELVNRALFKTLSKCFDSVGLFVFDQYFCFTLSQRIAEFFESYNQAEKDDMAAFTLLKSTSPSAADCLESGAESACLKIANVMSKTNKAALQLQERITSIGHLQLIRLCFNRELARISQLVANGFQETIETLNSAHLSQLGAKAAGNGELSDEEKEVALRLAAFMDRMGLTDPFKKVYGSFVEPDGLGKFLFYCVLAVLPRFSAYQIGLLKKQSDNMDGIPFLVGIMTLLNQFTDQCGKSFWDEAKTCVELCCLVEAKDQPFDIDKFMNFMSHAQLLSDFPAAEKFWNSVPQTLLA
ncbi:hypothetical protein D918_01762 [Trichuris suis]|nr:hypothetical protein D918_01762 [Trichuris suis]